MADIGFDDSSSDRLEGSHVHSVVGGLILKGSNKKTTSSPKESVLGLKKLAEEKRKRKLEEDDEGTKKVKALSSNCEANWEADRRDLELQGEARLSSGSKSKSRHYRTGLVETPSHTGGVNEEIREKQLLRLERDRETRRGGVYAQSRTKDKDEKGSRNDREGYRDRRDKYDDLDKKRYDKGERSSRRSRDYMYDKDDKGNYFKEPRTSRSEWEETPYRSSRSVRDEGYTPRYKSKDIRTPSRSSWDDEDSTPSRSKWEMPSPSRSISEDMRSERR